MRSNLNEVIRNFIPNITILIIVFTPPQKHRVVVPRDDFRRSTPRQSMAFFIHPDNDVIIECLDGSGHYAPITALDYLNYRLQVTYPSS